jgi:undecaprenyl-phosphate 4-deoxy-4-formamido-L-arabinose transferase
MERVFLDVRLRQHGQDGYKSMKPNLKVGLSVIVPVYNSGAILAQLVGRLEVVLVKIGMPFEIILINDGSQDQSWAVIEEMAKKKDWIRGFCLRRNFGQHNALLCGIRKACFEISVTLDDDLQNPPEEIPQLLACLSEDRDVVYGQRVAKRHGWYRSWASSVVKLAMVSTMGVGIARQISPFRVFRTSLRDALDRFESPFVSVDVLFSWVTQNFCAVRVSHSESKRVKSNYNFLRLCSYAISMVSGFSSWPLRFASIIGFIFSFFGLLILCYVVALYFAKGTPVAGFPFLASTIAIFSGIQLFSIGVIGEYLARMHFRMMGKPTYFIEKETQQKQDQKEAKA